MATTWTVKAGDTLWEIMQTLGLDPSNGGWRELAEELGLEINGDSVILQIGQKLVIDDDSGSSSTPTTTKLSSTAVIEYFGLQTGTDRSVYATWTWNQDNTEEYKVKWYYNTGDIVWFIGNDSTTKEKQSIYSAPSNAIEVKFTVQPISKKQTSGDTEIDYWTAEWSSAKYYRFEDNPPSKPDVPTVGIDGFGLTASLSNLDVNGTHIEFQVVKDDTTVFTSGKSEIVTSVATFKCTVSAGSEYKVRCRSIRGSLSSDWSNYSANIGTQPAASSGITSIKANSETSVYLEWSAVTNAETYDIEYSTQLDYFDGSDSTTKVNGIETNHYIKTGLESGQEYFFRVRAVNDRGESAWTEIKSVIIGTTPAAPTTWSSTTTGITGDALTLYWVHNCEDGSSQTYAEVEIYIGEDKETYTINTTSQEDDEKTMSYAVDTSSFVEGSKIQWRVRTAGITLSYGDWSVQRSVDIYAPPTLVLSLTDSQANAITELTSFPLYVSGEAGPNTQTPVSYHVTITANEAYETVDNLGNPKTVIAGEAVYSKYYDTTSDLLLQISAGDVSLANNISYTVVCTVAMNSGLTAESTADFTVAWSTESYFPNARIGVNAEDVSAYICPYCIDQDGELVDGIELAVYRREYDGTFTELATGLDNTISAFITDPHPALDFARYRIVATTVATGTVGYHDIPGYPVGEKSIIIQWNEAWTNFQADGENPSEQPAWSGSLVKLKYNVDVSEKKNLDTSLVKYIGRRHPVSYYGTQVGETADWKTEIPKTDTETLYALRRLSIWMGDVYVREPSGSGYWANVSVNFSQTHRIPTIPVNITVTRVEGGV